MKIALRILAVLGALLGVAVVVAYFLPRDIRIERKVVIAAAPEAVFPHVNSLQAFAAWSPWHGLDPAMKVVYSGPDSGVGNRTEWQSDKVGAGTQEITASVANERVDMALDFGDQGKADAWFLLARDGDATAVTWGFHTDLGRNPVARWMGLMFPGMIAADYEKGLASLKGIAEAK